MPEKPKLKQRSFYLSDEVHRAVRIFAAEKGVRGSHIAEDLLRKALPQRLFKKSRKGETR